MKWKKLTAIQKYRRNKVDLIRFEELMEIPVNEPIEIVPERPGAIETTRLDTNSEDLSFRVVMKKGEVWTRHYHDCTETLVVYKGRLRDQIRDKIAMPAQLLKFPVGAMHLVVAEEDSIFYVEFKKPK